MSTLYRAYLATRHFEFIAYGENEVDARATMAEALKAHAAQLDLAPDWATTTGYIDDMIVTPFKLGHAYRDSEAIFPPTGKPPSWGLPS